MSDIVVDASITLSWCFPDEQTALSIKVLDRLNSGDQALVPAFWSVEVLNTLLVGEKRGRISPEQTQMFLGDLRTLDPTLDYASLEQSADGYKPSAAISGSRLTMRCTSNSPCGWAARSPLWINHKGRPRVRWVSSASKSGGVIGRVAFHSGTLDAWPRLLKPA